MIYITTDVNTDFGIYDTVVSAEKAFDALAGNGFPSDRIFVLDPKNEDTREFARRKKTQVRAGIDAGPAANLPLAGTGGFLDTRRPTIAAARCWLDRVMSLFGFSSRSTWAGLEGVSYHRALDPLPTEVCQS